MGGLSKASTKAGRLQRACLGLLREHEEEGALPTSIRFLFYELVGQGVIPKTYGEGRSRTPSQDVAVAVKVLRDEALIPWAWIVDETRTLHTRHYAQNVYQYVKDVLPSARIDLWDGEAPPLILCESRSLAGVLYDIAGRYLCPIAATNGQAGGFLHTAIAPLVEEVDERRVLYLGDYDLSGGDIEENTYKVLSRYGPLKWERVAITREQVEVDNLPVKQKKDSRFNPPRLYPAVETEALGQVRIQNLLTRKLDTMMAEPIETVLEREEEQRVLVRKKL